MIIPDYLLPGDKVGVIATAKKLVKKHTKEGIDILNSWGLHTITGKYLFNSFHQFAGTDDQRIEDFQDMINNPDIKAIFMARGGYGTTRIIDKIDFTPLKKYPKWICGFSDITAIHLHLYNQGIVSLHAPMPSFFHAVNEKSLLFLKQNIFGEIEKYAIPTHDLNRNGEATGKIVGGNLSIICHTIGTPSEIKTKDNILFIEDVAEQLYRLDRMMVQMKRAGFLNNIAGLIVGQFSDMEDNNDKFGFDTYEIINSHIKEFKYPVAFNFPVGHTDKNYTIPIGMMKSLIVNDNSVVLE